MARTVRNAKLDSRSARVKLTERREPYWVVISKGCALGYRKGANGGSWIARYREDSGKQRYQALGAADDAMDADESDLCLGYGTAQRKANEWFQLAARGFEDEAPKTGPYTVKDALADYLAAYKRRGGKGAERTEWVIDARILPELGAVQLIKLSRRRIEGWLENLANAPVRLRTRPSEEQKFLPLDKSPEGIRRRKSSANRIYTVLKAALNHAYQNRKVANDEAWRNVKAYREADAARIRYLDDAEAQRVVNACAADFRPLVQAALLTGCRYGELTALIVSDYNPDAGTVHVRISKSGKPRHVVLSNEGKQFFQSAIHKKGPSDIIFQNADKKSWGKSHQQRPFKLACEAAKVGELTFHELRHTYASRLVMSKVPLNVVAAQLGHSDTRMVEKHYGHLAPSYIADTVREAFSSMGIVQETNVVSISVGS